MTQDQRNALFSDDRNNRVQAENEPAHCKTDQRLAINENPGAAATATGVEDVETDEKSLPLSTADRGCSATAEADSDRHLMACRSLAHTLPRTDQDSWWVLRSVLQDRLTTRELVSLAFMALKALDHVDARLSAEAALMSGAGQPIPPLIGYMDEAVFWADFAATRELEAYCWASFQRMAPERQAAFLDTVQRERIAA